MTDCQTDILLALLGTSAVNWISAAWLRYSKISSFVRVGTVSGLTLFPLKSCKGISLRSATAEVNGLHNDGINDRQWMLVRPNGEYLTQRQHPKMALISVSCHKDSIHVEAPDQPTLVLPKNPDIDRSKLMKTRFFTIPMIALDCGEEAAKWFSFYIGVSGLRLVISPKSMPKREILGYVAWESLAKPGDLTTFSDYAAYMVKNEASLQALNERLQNKVTMDNFRPNIIISGPKAFDEDSWQELRIGEYNPVYFRILEPCVSTIKTAELLSMENRCVWNESVPVASINRAKVKSLCKNTSLDVCILTTVNPKTGEKDKSRQPLETLKQFRCFPQFGKDPTFGVNAAIDNVGTVKVGDPVFALLK